MDDQLEGYGESTPRLRRRSTVEAPSGASPFTLVDKLVTIMLDTAGLYNQPSDTSDRVDPHFGNLIAQSGSAAMSFGGPTW